jgi:hypothetical protein
LVKRSQYDRLAFNGDSLGTKQASQAVHDSWSLELVRNAQDPDEFHHNYQGQIDARVFDCLTPRTFGALALVRLVDYQQPNQDVGIKRLHAQALRLQWRFACQQAKRDRRRAAE